MKWYNYKKQKPNENIIVLAKRKDWVLTDSTVKNYAGIRTGYYRKGTFWSATICGYGAEDPDEWTYIDGNERVHAFVTVPPVRVVSVKKEISKEPLKCTIIPDNVVYSQMV